MQQPCGEGQAEYRGRIWEFRLEQRATATQGPVGAEEAEPLRHAGRTGHSGTFRDRVPFITAVFHTSWEGRGGEGETPENLD